MALVLCGMSAAHDLRRASTTNVRVDIGQASPPVSPYEYGMFIEHIGPLIYRSLWSEMLDDRKFYFPISGEAANAAAQMPPFRSRMLALRTWQPVGPSRYVTMDPHDPFVGAHSPRIRLDASIPHGIVQSGLALVRGRRYTGYAYLRGAAGARVSVTLIWRGAARERQTLSLGTLAPAYRRFAFEFSATADSADAALEITGTGAGSFHIGAVSLMPADNVDGFRPEVISLLRELRSGFWRLPGGNFVSDFNWYDSVGDRDKRPPVFDYAWHAMQSNDVGMDEFMTFCRLIGVEPYVTVNAGFGDAHSAAEEVEYMNGPVTTRLGALRARNGHPEPYHVKFWDIGNEPYGTWELGRTDLKYSVLKHNGFAWAMREADPSITLLASAAMPDEMTIEGIASAMHIASDQVPICSDADWTCGFLKGSWGYFDGITQHWYARADVRFDLTRARKGLRINGMEAGYIPDHETVLQWVRKPSDRVRLKAEEWQEYEKRFPEMSSKKIFLSIDEYAYTTSKMGSPPSLKLVLAYAMVLNEMLRHTGFLRMSAFTMGVSTLNFDRTAAALNATGLLFKLYRDRLGAGMIPVIVSGNSPQPAPTEQLVPGLAQSSAGSPTYPLDVVAALSPDRKFLTIGVVNATSSPQSLALDAIGVRVTGSPTLWEMTGRSLEAVNRLGQPAEVTVTQRHVAGTARALSVPPISVDVYRFPVVAAPPTPPEGSRAM